MRVTFSLLTFLLIFSLSNGLFAQDSSNPWKFISADNISVLEEERQIFPLKYETISADLDNLKSVLDEAPLWFSGDAEDKTVVLTLPMPDGTFERFSILNAPVLHPELSAKYPGISTYSGHGIDDPTAYIRLDFTLKGFHGVIRSGNHSTVYIDPYSKNDLENYIVYYKKDFQKKSGDKFECFFENEEKKGGDQTFNMHKSAGDCQLRTYDAAIACTGEYTTFHGGTKALALSAITTTINRVNSVLEVDIYTTLMIIANNDLIIYLNGGTDPYNNNNACTMIDENITNVNSVIGSGNYDIGHVFATGGSGCAYLGSVCNSSKAGGATGVGSPIGDPFDIDYVAHEMGHQFGATHTQNNSCNRTNATAMEPGSASTIMGYAGICAPNVQNNSDDHFHAISIQQMSAHITGTTCATITNPSNSAPTANAGSDVTVPKSTNLQLVGIGTDADGDPMTFCWEQMDNQVASMPPSSTNTGGPAFRSISPHTSPIRYLPSINDIVANASPTWEVLPSVGRTLNFRLTVRDNHTGGGCTEEDDMVITVDGSSGPFLVTAPNTAVTWSAQSTQTVTWNVAGTSGAPVNAANVDILLSTDGGLTYPDTIVTGVTNDGAHSITVPTKISTTARIMVKASGNIFFDISNTDFTITAPANDYGIEASPSSQSICAPAAAVYKVVATGFGSFSGPVTLGTSNLPAGLSVSFSQNPVTVPPKDSSYLTIGNTSSLNTGTYNFDITASGSTGAKTETVTLVVTNGVPVAPTLTLPANNASGISQMPTLEWNSVSGADNYDIDVASDSNFGNIIESASAVTGTSHVSSNSLNGNTTYYWRVKANNSCGTGTFSSTFDFTTTNEVCTVYVATDVPKNISTSISTIISTLTISESGTINDLNFLNLDITHTWVRDLIIKLKSPDGTEITLVDRICSNQNNFAINFDDEASNNHNSIPCPPIGGGTYQADELLSAFDGKDINGTWTLTIDDVATDDGGSLNGWELDICYQPTVSCTAVWDGSAGDNLWTTASNWDSNIVPSSCTDVTIANGDIVALSTPANIKSLVINGGGLNIASTGSLTIDGSTIHGIHLQKANDYLENNGILNIANAGINGVLNSGTVTNNSGGMLTVSNSGNFGFNNTAGDILNNSGKLTITGSTNYGLNNNGRVNNNVGGEIESISGSSYGILNGVKDRFENHGLLTITSSTDDGFYNDGILTNHSTGEITISNSGDFGIYNNAGDQVTNDGILTITDSVDDGIFNKGTVTNNSGGTLTITNAGDFGFNNTAGDILNNSGRLTITGSTNYGLNNNGRVNNNVGGEIESISGSSYGVLNGINDRFENHGLLTITSSTDDGFYNDGILTNHSTGEITISNVGDFGIYNNTSDQIINDGILTITASLDDGILNKGTVTNNSGAILTISNSGDYGFNNTAGDILNNSGKLTITGSTDYGLNNNGRVNNNVGGEIESISGSSYGVLNGINDRFENHGLLTVAGSTDDGFYNDGILTNHSTGEIMISNVGDFGIYNNTSDQIINDGILTITASLDDGILNKGTVTNNSGAILTISNSGDYGFNNTAGDILNNSGRLTITGSTDYGLNNNGRVNNNVGGEIESISGSSYGVLNGINDRFENHGLLTVTGSTDDGFYNDGILTNHSTGEIMISNVGDFGIYNNAGDQIINDGILTITASLDDGILNKGTVTNNSGAILTISNSGDYGFNNTAGDILNNSGKLTITGSTDYGLNNNGRVNNNVGGEIESISGSSYGVLNGINDRFENHGLLTVTGSTDDGFYNDGILTNHSTGEIMISNVGDFGIYNNAGDQIINDGILTITASLDDGILNKGTVTNNSGAILTISNSGDYGFNNTAGDILNNFGVLSISGSNDHAILNTGIVTSTGTLEGEGTFKMNGNALDGVLAPGGDTEKMSFIANQEFTTSNTLEIDIEGITPQIEHDIIDVELTATIGGTLAPSFDAGYTPSSGDRVVFLTANSVSGTFSTISPALPGGWSIDYSVAGEVALVYSTLKPAFSNNSVNNAIPETSEENRNISISTNDENHLISIFPNPIRQGEMLTVKLDADATAGDLRLFDQFGKLIQRWEIVERQSSVSIEIPKTASGVYLLQINSAENLSVKKLVIE